ncbi:MAG: ATP-dependent sacrificial sulfur transferase LarE [Candidatus Eisenbacteria bacterium]|nr:ATP-dependent sacrificial sulfur transferase LarE [Candidatus Eisenbacteria bacterium]
MATHPTHEPSLLAIRDPDARPHAALAASERLALLRDWLSQHARVIVAYSGGVDSSLLLRVAHDVLGERALGVIGVSDSYASRELQLALDQAARFGARVRTVTTGELADPVFASNPTDRCYHCKSELYAQLTQVAAEWGGAEGPAVIVDGTIADDLSDWRPGRRAADERDVRSPLAELGFRKTDVRMAAESLGLSSAHKPASPCLASRIPYGTAITREALNQVEQAEALLRDLGFTELRVRHHGETARIEVPLADLPRLAAPGVRDEAVKGLQSLGFRWVALDLAGLRSGGLNPPEVLAQAAQTAQAKS